MGINFFNKNINFNKIRLKYEREQGYDTSHGYSIIKSSNNLKNHEYIMQLANEYDKYGYMSQELGEELDRLFSDDNYVMGIHRTGYTHINNEILNDIFNKGLINNGHVFTGANTGQCDIEKTVTLFNDFSILCGQLKASHGYKCSEGCVIVRIPKQCLYEMDKEPMPMYYQNDGMMRLLPQYVYGYVPVDKEGKLGNIHLNPNYREQVINNENLLFDDKIFYAYKRKGIELKKESKSSIEKYEIIKKAYIDTYNKYGNYQAEQALLYLINENEVKYFSGQNNRELLSKYVIYGNTLSILAITNPNLTDENSIIQSFISDCVYLNEKNKTK